MACSNSFWETKVFHWGPCLGPFFQPLRLRLRSHTSSGHPSTRSIHPILGLEEAQPLDPAAFPPEDLRRIQIIVQVRVAARTGGPGGLQEEEPQTSAMKEPHGAMKEWPFFVERC